LLVLVVVEMVLVVEAEAEVLEVIVQQLVSHYQMLL
jgi:hypothetical protein|tara:strand:- start:559 stop:666 length:108 start_codon:yes stop_codon:yes gene_type:complete